MYSEHTSQKTEFAGSKEFQNSYSSACQFALVPQLDKEGGSTCPAQILLGRTSGRVDSLDSDLPIKSLPNNKILDLSKLKALADFKRKNVIEKLKFVFGLVENFVGKGENAGYQHFLLFPQCFQNASFSRVVKSWDYAVKS